MPSNNAETLLLDAVHYWSQFKRVLKIRTMHKPEKWRMKSKRPCFIDDSQIFFLTRVNSTVTRIRCRVEEWAAYSRVKSLLNVNEIKDGIDSFYKDIDSCFKKFNVISILRFG